MAKKTATRKPAPKPMTEEQREVATCGLLLAECGAKIKGLDCAAYSVLVFSRGDAPPEYQQLGVEALSKFAEFGWATFHAIGGLGIDWNTAADNIIEKLRQLPRKK